MQLYEMVNILAKPLQHKQLIIIIKMIIITFISTVQCIKLQHHAFKTEPFYL